MSEPCWTEVCVVCLHERQFHSRSKYQDAKAECLEGPCLESIPGVCECPEFAPEGVSTQV